MKNFKFKAKAMVGGKPVPAEFVVQAQDETTAKKFLVDGQKEMGSHIVVESAEELPPPQPNPAAVRQGGGFYFPAWGIHVAASNLGEAKKLIKEHHEKDVDVDIPPPKMNG